MRRTGQWSRFGRGKINISCTCARWQSRRMRAGRRGSTSATAKSCCARRCSSARRSRPCSGARRRRFRCRTASRSTWRMLSSSSTPRRSCTRRVRSLPCVSRRCACRNRCAASSCSKGCRIPATSARSSARPTPSAWTPWCSPARAPISTARRPCARRWARSFVSRC